MSIVKFAFKNAAQLKKLLEKADKAGARRQRDRGKRRRLRGDAGPDRQIRRRQPRGDRGALEAVSRNGEEEDGECRMKNDE